MAGIGELTSGFTRKDGCALMAWCELCRDHYEVKHFDGKGNHKIGTEFGWFGRDRAWMRDVRAFLQDLADEPFLSTPETRERAKVLLEDSEA